jgi:DNA-binding CsgD family transcriptional regulator
MRSENSTKDQSSSDLDPLHRLRFESQKSETESGPTDSLSKLHRDEQAALAKFRAFVEQLPGTVIYMTPRSKTGSMLYVSPRFQAASDDLPGEYQNAPDTWSAKIHPEDYDRLIADMARCLETGKWSVAAYRKVRKGGCTIWPLNQASPAWNDSDSPPFLVDASTETTEQEHTTNELHSRENEQMAKSQREGLNAALRALLRIREEDREELRANVMSNVKEAVLPFLERLRNCRLDDDQKRLIDILESNLRDVVSPFIRELSSRFLNLTPAEIQVATLVREGKTTKEIAELLHLSENTILSHRYQIRGKLGLNNKRVNLRTYLRNLHREETTARPEKASEVFPFRGD